ncbi:MAG: glycosyl hydrolase [Alphaproteobacteria bacterium]|nr:glycosyl hydrolase [Alphaproteobacteria bacterium]MCW5740219.1 glycosyl hydrolase [Alphaproteobacteria bacterium]
MPRATKRTTARSPSPKGHVILLVATKKGAWLLHGDAARRSWRADGPHFLGNTVHHVMLDPRDRRTLLLAAKTGHLGPTVFRSLDFGRTWKEASRPPAFRKTHEGEKQRAVDHVFWLTPGHASEPGAWYAGSSPQGLFRSEDGGDSWAPVAGFNDHPMYGKWVGDDQDGTPDGPKMHSILVDPRDPAHLYIGMSGGGVFESRDTGASWAPLNAGCRADFFPDPYPEFGHDPHCMRLHPLAPDVLYQQNHCGIYRLERPSDRWERIGEKMPRSVGDIGFPMVLHPRDPKTVWVFPMDGSDVWPRVSVAGKAAAYVTRNAGKTWQRLDAGLPQSQAWFTVLRQAMTADARDPVGIYFGTTTGSIWASSDEGARWRRIAQDLPHVYAVEAAEVAG